ncbi:fibronectin type III domain-containing protein [Paenibacillus periandrae]|uniref:RCC1 domain-containing protein n=1 Tax=Paenibacillus periandrae TaxID=1761741 RepID=UPI001F088F27|nr:fibronectin type III domain-containing protein [Paenibacillus periandrae]
MDANENFLDWTYVDYTEVTSGYQNAQLIGTTPANTAKVRVYVGLRGVNNAWTGNMLVDDMHFQIRDTSVILHAPTNLSVQSVTGTEVNLVWSAPADPVGISGYDIYRDTDLVGSVSGTSNTFVVTGLRGDTAYFFTVKSKDANGNQSEASNIVGARTAPRINWALNKPTQTDGNYSSSMAGDKAVDGKLTDNSKWYVVGSGEHWLIVDLAVAMNVGQFVVKHAASGGEGVWANTKDFTIQLSKDGIHWTTVVNVTGNTLNETVHDIVSTQARYAKLSITTPTSTTDDAVRIYEFEVYGEPSTVPSDVIPPTAPSDVEVSRKTDTSVSLTWTASTDNVEVTGYEIYNGSALVGTSASTSYTLTGLSEATSYTISIKARDAAGNLSAESNLLVVTTEDVTPPTAPTDLTVASKTGTSVNLTWSASTDNVGVTGYEVYNGNVLLAAVNGMTHTVNDLTPGVKYIFTVKAIDAVGNVSPASNSLTTMTFLPTDPMMSMNDDHTIGLRYDGTVWQWGHLLNKENGLWRTQGIPEKVNLIDDAVMVAAGYLHNLALKNDGTVWVWGAGNAKQVPGLSNIKAITAGSFHSVALKDDGTVWQFGDGTNTTNSSPQQIVNLSGIVDISAKWDHTLALKNDGTVWAWGNNIYGQLGDGSRMNRLTPQQVIGLTNVTAISAGFSHSLAITSNGALWAWGGSYYSGVLGNGTSNSSSTTPVPVSVSGVFQKIAAGGGFSLALKDDGTIWTWGSNAEGQLGSGSKGGYRDTPYQIQNLRGVSSISAGGSHSGAITNTGTYFTWGYAFFGQLGNSEYYNIATPSKVIGPNLNISDVEPPTIPGSFYASINSNEVTLNWTASTDDSLVKIYNIYNGNELIGRTGTLKYIHTMLPNVPYAFSVTAEDASGNESLRTNPIHFQNPEAEPIKVQMALGNIHSLALLSNGTVWAWGYGALGNGMEYIPDSIDIAYRSGRPVQTGINDVIRIGAGNEHSIALKNDGTVWTWGNNRYGQLGNETTVKQILPVQVSGLSNIREIVAGRSHSVALKSDGTVWTWGRNHKGQLGDGTIIDRITPVQVANLSGVKAISANGDFTLVLKDDGTVWGWGANNYGQLGDAATIDRLSPVKALVNGEVRAIAAGGSHSLALKNDGTVWEWGWGSSYDSVTNMSLNPVQVLGINNPQGIAAGSYHSMAYMNNGELWTWGHNTYGQLGNGTSIGGRTPVQVNGISNVVGVAGGAYHSAAITYDGIFHTWGNNNYSQLGNGTFNQTNGPQMVIGPNVNPADTTAPSAPLNLSAEGGTTSVILSWEASIDNVGVSEYVIYMGDTFYKKIQDGETTHTISNLTSGTTYNLKVTAGDASGNVSSASVITVTLKSLPPFKNDIVAGPHTNYALKEDGTLWAWGSNRYGQLQDGTTTDRTMPVNVGSKIIDVAAELTYSVALRNDTTVIEIGDGATGQPLPKLINIKQVAAGRYHTLALKDDGTVWSWGSNSYGQLGDGTKLYKLTPVQVTNLTNVKAIVANGYFTLALKNDGTVWAWGSNSTGQLGDGTIVDRLAPVQVIGLQGIIEIRAGSEHGLALKNDGTVWVWGANNYGQLGNGTTSNSLIPVTVTGLLGVKGIAAGYNHSMAYQEDGTLWTWGWNEYGQLGIGNLINSTAPVRVQGIKNVKRIAGGYKHSVALTSTGIYYAWGDNSFAQIGNGTNFNSKTPLEVIGPNVNPADIVPPTAPLNLTLLTTPSTNTLTWTASTDNVGVSEYVIYNGATVVATIKNGETMYSLSSLPEGTSYSYRVVAKDATGNVSPYSNNVTGVVDHQAPTVPRQLKITERVGDTLTLSWLESTDNVGVAGYSVYKGTELIGTTSASTTTYTVTGIPNKALYIFSVKAFDAAGNFSAKSEVGGINNPHLRYNYDQAGRLKTITNASTGEVLQTYHYDLSGNLVKVTIGAQ